MWIRTESDKNVFLVLQQLEIKMCVVKVKEVNSYFGLSLLITTLPSHSVLPPPSPSGRRAGVGEGWAQQQDLAWPKGRENLGLQKILQSPRENSQVLCEEEDQDASQQSSSNSVRVREWEGHSEAEGVL